MGPMKLILVVMWRCTHMHDSKKKMWWSITSANYCILVTFYIFFITDNSPLYKLDQGLNPALVCKVWF